MNLEMPSAVPEMGPLVRVRVLVAYDGSAFHGFAYQPNEIPTVARSLRLALSRLMGYEPPLTVAGRTDTGVHAWGQVVSFDMPASVLERFDFHRIQRSLNRQLNPEVVVREIGDAPADFDARASAKARRYRYTILNAELPSPFLAGTAWHVPVPLDVGAMNEACAAILGEHDFSSFCRRPPGETELFRRVDTARWLGPVEGIVRFDVEAKAFCHQMVRSLVGTLVGVGAGKRKPEEMATVLEKKDRHAGEPPAPPHGLCLWEVVY